MSPPKIAPEVYLEHRLKGMSNYDIADLLGVSEASVRRGLRKIGYAPHLLTPAQIKSLHTQLEKPIRIDSKKLGPGAVTADWHHPLADYKLVNTFLDHVLDVGANNWLVVAGDWFNIDSLSRFDFKQKSAGLEREIEASEITMRKVLEVFPQVYMSWGNHDARVHKTLGYKVPFATAMQMMFPGLERDLLDRIQFSNLDHIWIDTANGPYYVAHPASYNQNPLTNARRLATVKHAHVITGHSHHSAIGFDPSAKFVTAELGGFFDRDKVQYLQRTTTYPNWQPGYALIDREGFLTVEAQGWSSRIGRRA